MLKLSHSRTLALGFLSLFLLCMATVSTAHNKVVVIPMSGDDLKPLKNIITVAKENGDFADPVAAMSSITNASATNPYLVVIAPGEYILAQNRGIHLRQYIEVTGSGQNSTFIKGNVGSDSTNAVINGSGSIVTIDDNSSISNLTIENTGTTFRFGHGVHYNSGTSTSERASMSNITINVSSSSNSELIGLVAQNGELSVLNAKIFVSAGSGGRATGIQGRNTSGSPRVSLNILNADIEVTGSASTKVGIANTSATSIVRLQNSTINVPSGVVESLAGAGNNETYISNSFLSGPAFGAKCSFVFRLTGLALNSSCQ